MLLVLNTINCAVTQSARTNFFSSLSDPHTTSEARVAPLVASEWGAGTCRQTSPALLRVDIFSYPNPPSIRPMGNE